MSIACSARERGGSPLPWRGRSPIDGRLRGLWNELLIVHWLSHNLGAYEHVNKNVLVFVEKSMTLPKIWVCRNSTQHNAHNATDGTVDFTINFFYFGSDGAAAAAAADWLKNLLSTGMLLFDEVGADDASGTEDAETGEGA